MSKYEVIIYWSKDDQAFIAEVPELPGCAADGATYQEALANVETVIREWIETAKDLGRPIPEPKGRLAFASKLERDSVTVAFAKCPACGSDKIKNFGVVKGTVSQPRHPFAPGTRTLRRCSFDGRSRDHPGCET